MRRYGEIRGLKNENQQNNMEQGVTGRLKHRSQTPQPRQSLRSGKSKQTWTCAETKGQKEKKRSDGPVKGATGCRAVLSFGRFRACMGIDPRRKGRVECRTDIHSIVQVGRSLTRSRSPEAASRVSRQKLSYSIDARSWTDG